MDQDAADKPEGKPKCDHPFTTGPILITKPGYYEICRGCFKPIYIRALTTEEIKGSQLDQWIIDYYIFMGKLAKKHE